MRFVPGSVGARVEAAERFTRAVAALWDEKPVAAAPGAEVPEARVAEPSPRLLEDEEPPGPWEDERRSPA